MKKITLKHVLTFAMLLTITLSFGQNDNRISLDPTGGGSEGDSKVVDDMEITISAAGVVSLPTVSSVDFVIDAALTGNVTLSNAQNKTFKMNWAGMATTNTTTGTNFGALLTQGGIDRSSSGDLGIRTGANAGINSGEGYIFGFDCSNFQSSITLRVRAISLTGVGAPEEVTIVNRADTSKQLSTQVNGNNDVTALDLTITGGTNNAELVSIFHSGPSGGLRVNGIVFELLDSATLSANKTNAFTKEFSLNSNPVLDNISVSYNSKKFRNLNASLVDMSGRVIEKKNLNGNNTNNFSFNANALSAGMYFVNINHEGKTGTIKVLKK